MAREAMVSCRGAVSARLVTPPAHGEVTDVSTDANWLHFVARPDADAPPYDQAVFEVAGHEGSIQLRVSIVVVPLSQNSAPVCDGDKATQRTDGTRSVYLLLHPFCRDPDGDDFTIEGGPPGTHPQSPKYVPAGQNDSNWPYRTATFSGTETTTIWATDSLGARSKDAQLEVTVGTGIDRPPECIPSMYQNQTPIPIYSRPGMTRRFGIVCTDPDADLLTARLSSLPQRGLLLPLEAGAPQFGYYGLQRWIDATYVPKDDSPDRDLFSITATGVHGDGPTANMAIVPRGYGQNAGGSCGWSPTTSLSGVPAALKISCADEDGDPLSTEIVTEPRHGTVTSPQTTPALYGYSTISIPYVPEMGYDGYDCVKVKVSDGYGLAFNITLDITVKKVDLPVEVDPPPVELPPVDPPPVDPPAADPPPADLPPVEVPPADAPPVDPPPVDSPPVDPPPVDSPPVDPPPVDPPPDHSPPVDPPPAELPPDAAPPVDPPGIPDPTPSPTPPAEQPPDAAPPVEPPGLPDLTPPASDPPASDPPASDPPASDDRPRPDAQSQDAPEELDPLPPREQSVPAVAQSVPAPPVPAISLLPPVPSVAVAHPRQVRHAVERALGTTAVKRLSARRGTQVWARSTMSRHDLTRWGRAPGLVVICSGSCKIQSGARLVTGRRSAHASARRTVVAAGSGRPVVLSLTLAPAERRAVRRARNPRGRFTLTIRAAGTPIELTRSVRVSR